MTETFQDLQREFMRTHPGVTAGTALPSAQMINDVHLAEALDDLSERLAEVEQRLSRLEKGKWMGWRRG